MFFFFTCRWTERRVDHQGGRGPRHLRDQQTDSKQADLALLSHQVGRRSGAEPEDRVSLPDCPLSLSLCSGPKRYDWTGERWVYAHDGASLHQLLSKEFSAIYNRDMDLLYLPYS